MKSKTLHLVSKIVSSPHAFIKYAGYCLKQYRYNDLIQFANEVRTDKSIPGHNYVRVYDAFLRDRRDSIAYLCEVGLLRLSLQRKNPLSEYPEAPSLRMWRKYLPHTHLVGFDIQKFKEPTDPHSVIIQGDQSSRKDLQKIIDHHDVYNVIIDDALHASPHQQITLSYLFPHLAPGGLYFIEDLRYQPTEFERRDVPTTLEVLKEFAATGVWSSPLSTPEEKAALERSIERIHFFESLKGADPVTGADAIAVIVKK